MSLAQPTEQQITSFVPKSMRGLETPALEYHEARSAWQLVDLQELWRYRDLLWILALRDLKVRYRQTFVGVAWAVVQPATSMFIFLTLFSLLGRQPASAGAPYALVVVCGLLIWQLFAGTLNIASGSLVNSQHLIGKAYFPRLVLPLVSPAPGLVDFSVGLLLVAALLPIYSIAPSWRICCVPFFAMLAVSAALALGIGAAALNAMYRDTGIVIGFVLQVGFFVSPVFYVPAALIPQRWTWLYQLNPLCGAIEGMRWAVLGGGLPTCSIAMAIVVIAAVLAATLAYFRRIETFVADRI